MDTRRIHAVPRRPRLPCLLHVQWPSLRGEAHDHMFQRREGKETEEEEESQTSH